MLPEWLVSDFRIMYQHFQTKGLIASLEQIAETERILGRKPRSFDSFIAEITKAWKQEKMVAATMRMTS